MSAGEVLLFISVYLYTESLKSLTLKKVMRTDLLLHQIQVNSVCADSIHFIMDIYKVIYRNKNTNLCTPLYSNSTYGYSKGNISTAVCSETSIALAF